MNNDMKKRGLSPLISWILIIAFSVAMGMLIIPAMIDNIKHNLPKENIEYCQDVRMSFDGPGIGRLSAGNNSNGTLLVIVKNTGSFSIQKLTIGRTTSLKAQQWCDFSNFSGQPLPLKPGESKAVTINLDQNYYFNITSDEFSQCNVSVAPSSDVMVAQIELVPWIKVEDELIQCDDKNIILKDSTTLNRII